ncbi:DUF1223 domain-containing protein [Aestuariibius sp. 2305UL40-4]|uniref:DUF1223 domain-containing protein n=1 Tax=Aestuariibius violaceus TaxID=3234132 RepID=UPI00345E3E7B
MAALLMTPAKAETTVVVELFTSQGCSSCPPADAILREMAPRDDVIALALHVDYWDYIGWKDIFGDPAHTERQRAYARAAGERTVYTPQFVIAGQDHVVGIKPMKLVETIMAHQAQPPAAVVTLGREGDVLAIRAVSADLSGPIEIHLFRYIPSEEVRIARGENRGRTLTYANIVSEWQIVGRWDPRTPFEKSVPVAGPEPVVVIAQRPEGGPIFGAARLR